MIDDGLKITAQPSGVLLVGYCSGPEGEPGCRSLIGEAGAGRRCANQTPAATSPTTGHSTTPVTARAPAARYTTGIGAPANACSATVTGASSTALSVAADEPDGAGALTAGPAAGVRAGGVFGDAGMPCLFPQRGRATAPCCGHARLAAKDPAGPAPLPVGPPSPATPSQALLTARVAAALVTLNPGLRRLPPADRVAFYTAWPSSGFPGSSDACGPDRRSRTAPARPRLGLLQKEPLRPQAASSRTVAP